MPYKDPEENREYNKAWYQAHKEECKHSRREYYSTHRAQEWAARQKPKLDVFSHYSNGNPKCAVCGEDDPIVLCIDHINNDGAEHRKIAGAGIGFYCWLKRNDYPEGFQVLCRNCNFRKEFERNKAKSLQI